jgi:hypothetical protein
MSDTSEYLKFFFVAIAALGIVGIFAIREVRRRELAGEKLTRWQQARPAQLKAAEFALLRRWQRNMRLTAVATLFYLGVMVGFVSTIPAEAWVARWIALLALPALVIAGVALQFSVRCPRCGLLLGVQTSLGIPGACERCGVSYREKP